MKKEIIGYVLLRVSMALVFLYFGIVQLYNPANWVGYIPSFVEGIMTAGTAVVLNGSLEVI